MSWGDSNLIEDTLQLLNERKVTSSLNQLYLMIDFLTSNLLLKHAEAESSIRT